MPSELELETQRMWRASLDARHHDPVRAQRARLVLRDIIRHSQSEKITTACLNNLVSSSPDYKKVAATRDPRAFDAFKTTLRHEPDVLDDPA